MDGERLSEAIFAKHVARLRPTSIKLKISE